MESQESKQKNVAQSLYQTEALLYLPDHSEENASRMKFDIPLVEVIIRLWVQSGMNLNEWVFQKVSNFNQLAGQVKFELFEKSREKLYDYLLITYMKKFNGRSLTEVT